MTNDDMLDNPEIDWLDDDDLTELRARADAVLADLAVRLQADPSVDELVRKLRGVDR